MPELSYFLVDVFTEEPLVGNQLAVVLNTCNLSTGQMQAIAREFNLSETSFVERRTSEQERAEGVRVRIFTTQEELNFAGHPTLGTASVLKLHAPETAQDSTITLALNIGSVPVSFDADSLRGTMTQPEPKFGEWLDRTAVAQLIGVSEADLDGSLGPQIVSTGTAFAIVVLRSLETLKRLRVDQEAATRYLRERAARWFYVLAPPTAADGIWRARMQFNGGEDPATGSAAGCAISYLVKHGAVGSGERTHVLQGAEIGRPSHLFLSAQIVHGSVTDVRVGGSTVPVAKGTLFLP